MPPNFWTINPARKIACYTARMAVVLVFSTFGSESTAQAVARTLVEEQLAACVNLVGPIQSIYRWQGEIQDDRETLAIAKTTDDKLEALRARLVQLHPYELPEVVALPVTGGHAPYLAWVTESVQRG